MFSAVIKYINDLKNTDLRKVKVTSEGDFYINSKDLFDDEENSIKLIDSLRKSVDLYKKRTKEKVDQNLDNAKI